MRWICSYFRWCSNWEAAKAGGICLESLDGRPQGSKPKYKRSHGRICDRRFVRASVVLDDTRASANVDSMEIHTFQNVLLHVAY